VAAPRLARPFVLAFLVVMAAAAILVWEPWPITSFRLFSHLRQDQQHGWAAASVDADGVEKPLQLAELSSGFRGFGFRMAEFESSSWDRRDEICRTWVAPLADAGGGQQQEIRIYRTEWRLSRRVDGGERAAPPRQTLAFVCTHEGARRGGPK
jgi:hypothetical protein